MQAMQISATGLDVEWQRLAIIASNIANMGTVRGPDGQPFRAMHMTSGPAAASDGGTGVRVYGVEPTNAPPRRVYEPANPEAGSDGFVTYPGFDHAAEMLLMMQTSRAYQANLAVLASARQMYAKAAELGGRS